MTDPDERIINRAIVELPNKHQDLREEARAALHRLFHDRRSLEREVERLQALVPDEPVYSEARVESLKAEVERLREDLRAADELNGALNAERTRLFEQNERLRAWNKELERALAAAQKVAIIDNPSMVIAELEDRVKELEGALRKIAGGIGSAPGPLREIARQALKTTEKD